MTHDLIEKMIGHRTRVVQQRPEVWHEQEEISLKLHAQLGRRMDRFALLLRGVVPRGWLLLGVLAIGPGFLSGAASAGELAVGLGATIFASRALGKLVRGMADIADALISGRQVSTFLRPVPSDGAPPDGVVSNHVSPSSRTAPLLLGRAITYQYPGRRGSALQNCSISILPGDRVLIEGASGSGKSTLAAILAGLRRPVEGLVLFDDLDLETVGVQQWRRSIALAPQFHENYVFTGTLAFNLLMGRRWPPTHEDLREAEELCRELGLGPLIDRMPGVLMQMVGDTGWQLSHGERVRVFLARALLQRPAMVVVDEALGALDPDTALLVARALRSRSPTLVLIAHR